MGASGRQTRELILVLDEQHLDGSARDRDVELFHGVVGDVIDATQLLVH